MVRSVRFWIVTGLVLLMLPFVADWSFSRARLERVNIETWLSEPSVMADGKHSLTIHVRVTEDGRPRGGDVIQCWLNKGQGLLISPWIITDENGEGRTTYTPNPYSPYDPVDNAQIDMRDTTIGRLIEVGKEHTVLVPLDKPQKK